MADEDHDIAVAAGLLARGLDRAAHDLGRQVLARSPSHAQALRFLAQADDDPAPLRRAIGIEPDFAPALNDYGLLLQKRGQGALATWPLAQAAALTPEIAAIWSNLAAARMGAGHPESGARFARRALVSTPGNAAALYNLGMCRLATGDFGGFEGHEYRFAAGAVLPSPIKGARWTGETRSDATLYLHAEQGLGDTLLFARFVPLVKQRVGRVVLGVQPQLLRLLQNAADLVVSVTAPPPAFDFQSPLMSAPFHLGATRNAVPPAPPLWPDPAKVAEFKRRLGPLPGRKIGLVWQGNPQFPGDPTRSIPPDALAPFGAIPNISWISLQQGADRARPGIGPPMIDWMDETADLAETAALIANLDLVIAVDTMLGHLSGALGRPVWIMNRFNTCWRWFLDRDDSPWYPTVRLFRQPAPGDWEAVVTRVAKELAN